jgi:anaerobic selenocysteine-containing dehydrogenase
VGFNQLREKVIQYSPKKVEEITWVPASIVRDTARMYAGTKPAAIHQGPSLDHCVKGTQTFRAISILVAITGNFDVPGGHSYVLHLNPEGFRMPRFLPKEEPVGKEYPLFGTLPSQIARCFLRQRRFL